ncbi:riboflavin synthase [Acidothermaceae bacterium B102]|nr:riboflavin synthase [Acidothermaceae bacterium B102]
MFTGIVEELGDIVALEQQQDAARITVRGPLVVSDAHLGDSICVSGCCLTVTAVDGDTFTADVMLESLRRTTLGLLGKGSPVNLERAMPANGRMGGHVVQGHVDVTGTVAERTPSEHWEVVRITMPAAYAAQVVDKGSVTVDGVSLTVVEVGDDWFTVSLIPETLARTTLGHRDVGEPVNLEFDVIGKYVERLLAVRGLIPIPTTAEQGNV